MLMALPASFNTLDARTGNFGDYAIGYGGLMHIRDVETEDMAIAFSDYDHFQPWETLDQMGDNMARTQWLWNYQYEVILSANKAHRRRKGQGRAVFARPRCAWSGLCTARGNLS